MDKKIIYCDGCNDILSDGEIPVKKHIKKSYIVQMSKNNGASKITFEGHSYNDLCIDCLKSILNEWVNTH